MVNQESSLNPLIGKRRHIVRQSVLVLVLGPFFMAGCARLKPASTTPEPSGTEIAAPPKGASADSSPTPQTQRPAATPPPHEDLKAPSSASTVPADTAAGTQGEAKISGPSASKTNRPSAESSEKVPAAAGSVGQTPRQGAVPRIPEKPVEGPPEKPQASVTLDIASLEQRLRDTRAIGVFTKLSLKNQVDDLLAQFRAYHRKEAKVSLTELRQRYNLLLLKVLTLLQDNDAPLAAAISSSREALWLILTDPEKFAKIDVQ
jgi:hypothetical protein